MNEPAAIDWGPRGVIVTFAAQPSVRPPSVEEVRDRLIAATVPRLTIKQLARVAGVSPQALYALRVGSKIPNTAICARILAALNAQEAVRPESNGSSGP